MEGILDQYGLCYYAGIKFYHESKQTIIDLDLQISRKHPVVRTPGCKLCSGLKVILLTQTKLRPQIIKYHNTLETNIVVTKFTRFKIFRNR